VLSATHAASLADLDWLSDAARSAAKIIGLRGPLARHQSARNLRLSLTATLAAGNKLDAEHFVKRVGHRESWFRRFFVESGVDLDSEDVCRALGKKVAAKWKPHLDLVEFKEVTPDFEKLVRFGLRAMGFPKDLAEGLFKAESAAVYREYKSQR
jgi:hypothetical protein